MSTNFGQPFGGSPDPDERGGAPADATGQAGPARPAGPGAAAAAAGPCAAPGTPAASAPSGTWAPGNPYAAGGAPAAGSTGNPYPAGGVPAAGSSDNWYHPYSASGPGGYGPGGYGPGGYGPGGYGPGGYGPGGYGPGYPAFGGGPGDGRRTRRRRMLFAGGSAAIVAALAVAGFSAANAFGSSTLTTAQISSKVDPGLVDITTNLGYQQERAAGTGMVLTSSGEVLTNNHVIRGATQIKARDVGNGHTYTAKVVGYDQTDDVAILQLKNASGLQTVSLSSSAAGVGDKVVALGNALGKGGTPAVATGKVTQLGQSITASDESAGTAEQLHGMIQTNAPIQPGDSGGALVNRSGQIVGMNTAASSNISTTGFSSQGQTATQAFAIPISKATTIANQIEAGRASSTVHIGATAFLGVQVTSGSTGGFGGFGGFGGSGSGGTTASGAGVAGVVSGSAAAQAGLTQGDAITSVAGHTVTSPSGIAPVLAKYHPGSKISISWTDQAGQSHSTTVTLTTGPAA
ncbi:MAG TPA: trypsin-like peptidase domain-containing protein [Streptosporangiaceae bacterium]|nr:trypsin-like peptidase domain-containing protein [Streptosporangiaceae bacterium]